VKHYAGSRAYGISLPTSDIDVRGVFCADPINIRTPLFPIREIVDSSEEDTKYYELSHFMKLCLECNPNIIETLWVSDEDITYRTTAYNMLRSERHMLLSSKIAFTTTGYATAQLKRIKGHNKWISNPQPKEPPKPCDFFSVVQWFGKEKNLKIDISSFKNNHRLIPYSDNIYGVYSWNGYNLYDKDGNINDRFEESRENLNLPLMIIKWNKEEYKRSKERHTQYWTWKKERNPIRSELEEKYGYDTKHAAHLVRLMRMGKEALQNGEIVVKRPDADELINIRNGSWKYEELIEYAEYMDHEIRENWYKNTNLPKYQDLKFAAQLLMDIQDAVWNQKI
jgi:predicted nucleotidyltransferase